MSKAPWLPKFEHPAISDEGREAVAPVLALGMLKSLESGGFESSETWNRLLPDYSFTQPENFLSAAWGAIDAGTKSVPFEDY